MKFKSTNFSCQNCGAPLRFSPISKKLLCLFCDTTSSIKKSQTPIEEYSFNEALKFLKHHPQQEKEKKVICNQCSATFTLKSQLFGSNCPYCNTPAIIAFVKEIDPKSLLPFQISQQQAQQHFKKWIGSLWFTPSKLKNLFNGNDRLKGYYLPYWTYDSTTNSHYHGERGDVYYVEVERTVIVNGKKERRMVRESRIRWHSVNGELRNNFDDIIIGASKSISHTILDNLNPWHTDQLVPFNHKYLLGFDSEEYTIGLDSGFEFAKIKMENIIRQDIKKRIGGDQQRIHHLKTLYTNTTYKSVLFPLWTAEFQWKKRSYHYAINGQTGKVTGEHPYSWFKIGFLFFIIISLFATFTYVANKPDYIEKLNLYFS